MSCRLMCCMLACTSFVARAESGADAILNRLAESVARAGTSYTVEVRKWTTWDDSDSAIPSRAYIALRRSGDRFRSDSGLDRSDLRSQFVTDGTHVWQHSASLRQYKEDLVASQLGTEVMEHLRDFDRLMFGRFLLLSKFRVIATQEGTSVVKTRDGEHRCDVIRIIPKDAHERSWEERLWIDAASGLMRKSIVRRRVIVPEANLKRERGETETIIWEQIALDGPIDEAVFQFVPPRSARLVKKFEPPMGPQSFAPPSP